MELEQKVEFLERENKMLKQEIAKLKNIALDFSKNRRSSLFDQEDFIKDLIDKKVKEEEYQDKLREYGPFEDRKTKIHIVFNKLIKMFIPDYIKPGLFMYNQPTNINLKSILKGIPFDPTSFDDFLASIRQPVFQFGIQNFFSLMKLSNIKTIKLFI